MQLFNIICRSLKAKRPRKEWPDLTARSQKNVLNNIILQVKEQQIDIKIMMDKLYDI